MKLAKLGCLLAGTAMLSGCQSFPLTSWMFKGHRPEAASVQLAQSGAGSLEEGKDFLRQGNIASAVASLRVARLDRATFGEASNALAIAYARLGRPDLADRYFREAIMSEPENDKYAANLLRLQSDVLLARAQAAAPAVAAATPPPAPVPQPSSDGLAYGTVERVSRTEVRVLSRSDLGNAPIAVVAQRDNNAPVALAAHRDTPAEAVPAPSPASAASVGRSYPIRIQLPDTE